MVKFLKNLQFKSTSYDHRIFERLCEGALHPLPPQPPVEYSMKHAEGSSNM